MDIRNRIFYFVISLVWLDELDLRAEVNSACPAAASLHSNHALTNTVNVPKNVFNTEITTVS